MPEPVKAGKSTPQDRLVFEYAPDSIDYNCNIFHHSDYVKRRWSKFLSIVNIIPREHSYQTAVILQEAHKGQ
jgi:hypothetical protein